MTSEAVVFRDCRIQELWARNDAETILAARKNFPWIVSEDEVAGMSRHLGFLRTDKTYRDFCSVMRGPKRDKWDWEQDALTKNPRWMAARDHILQKQSNAKRVLDLGTWTGAHGIDLSNHLPNAEVFLREVVTDCKRVIQYTIKKYAANTRKISVSFGDHLVPTLPSNLDVIFSGEVLEHVRDVRSFAKVLERACAPGGLIVLTTTVEIPRYENRQHVHVRHLFGEDIAELFSCKPDFFGMRVGMNHLFGWRVYPGIPPVGEINWRRKLYSFGIFEGDQ